LAVRADGAAVLWGWLVPGGVRVDYLVIAPSGIFVISDAEITGEIEAVAAMQLSSVVAAMLADGITLIGAPVRPLVAVGSLAESVEIAEVTFVPPAHLSRTILRHKPEIGFDEVKQLTKLALSRLTNPG
jgi:hypothetical protein